jgi:hypothetical protein
MRAVWAKRGRNIAPPGRGTPPRSGRCSFRGRRAERPSIGHRAGPEHGDSRFSLVSNCRSRIRASLRLLAPGQPLGEGGHRATSRLLQIGSVIGLCFLSGTPLGCSRRDGTAIESERVEILFASFAGRDWGDPLGMFVLHNGSEDSCRLLSAAITRDTDSNEVPSDLLKFTSRDLPPDAWEYGVVRVNREDLAEGMGLRIEYESGGKLYCNSRTIRPSDVWCEVTFAPSESPCLMMYVNGPERFNSEFLCHVNGVEAARTSTAQVETADGTHVLAVRIEPEQPLDAGARVFAQLSFDESAVFGGATKVFCPFVAGETQYGLVVRPVNIEYPGDVIKLRLYNEADFRKSPAMVERVRINGEDVTERSVLPDDPLPPDLHNYDEDLRELVALLPLACPSDELRFDIDFRRLPPLRSEPTPPGYFDTQTASFGTREGVPFAVGPENGFGLEGGVCLFYGGLRPRPDLPELVRRGLALSEKAPGIPVFAAVPHGTKPEDTHQVAACCDFVVVGQPSPLSEATLHRSGVFLDSFPRLNSLPVPWAASILLDNEQCTSPEELEWIAWATIGSGGHGVLLSYADRGDERIVSLCESAIADIVDDVSRLAPLLEMSNPIPIQARCSQEGVRINCLMCGTEHLLVIAVNEWTSRASFQAHEPYMAAVRHGVEVRLAPEPDWVPESAIDPLTEQRIDFTNNSDNTTTIRFPQFDSTQLVLLKRSSKPSDGLSEPAPGRDEELPPLVALHRSPVVVLGEVRPESVHRIEFPIKSHSKEPLSLTATAASDVRSRPGAFVAPEVTVLAGEEATLSIEFTAPASEGESVTNIRFASPRLPDLILPIYVCAEVEDPATLFRRLVDFGMSAMGSKTGGRRVAIHSSDPTARIGRVVPGNRVVRDIQIAEDGNSFSFSLQPDEIGRIASAMDVEVLLGDGKETVRRSLQFTVQSQQAVFATPSRIATVISSKPQKYTLIARHVGGQPIAIVSLSHGDAIQSHFERETYRATQQVELTLLPESGSEGEGSVAIHGKTKAGDTFALTVPVSVISLANDRKNRTAVATGGTQ